MCSDARGIMFMNAQWKWENSASFPFPGEWSPCRKRNSHSRSTALEWEDSMEISGQDLCGRKGPQSSAKKPRETLLPGAFGSHQHPSLLLPPLNPNTTSLLQNLYFEAFFPVILSMRRNKYGLLYILFLSLFPLHWESFILCFRLLDWQSLSHPKTVWIVISFLSAGRKQISPKSLP